MPYVPPESTTVPAAIVVPSTSRTPDARPPANTTRSTGAPARSSSVPASNGPFRYAVEVTLTPMTELIGMYPRPTAPGWL